MALFVFSAILVLSVIIAILSKKGAISSSMKDVMVASGGFGPFLIFFVSVGEIYSIGTMIGAPGSVYAKGASYAVWFVSYILLAYVVGYFLNPAIWRMGKLADAVTISDVIGWRFNSKGMQVIVALVGIMFLTPWIQNQFSGMGILFKYLNIGVSFTAGVIISTTLAFIYIAVAGIRAPAWVSVLKDLLLVMAIIIAGVTAAMKMPGGVHGIFSTVAQAKPEMLTVPTQPVTAGATFLISTILFQMCGFYMLPISFQAILTSQNETNLRRNSIYMPIYMIMFPFLFIVGYFAMATMPGLEVADYALLAVVVENLPQWVVGLVAGGGALTAILVMAITALCVGGLFSKNILGVIKPDMPEKNMTTWTRVATGVFLFFGVMSALYFPALMANVITLAYSGLTQTFIAIMFGFFWKKATKWGLGAGIIVGVVTIFYFKFSGVPVPFALNPGFVALVLNLVVATVVSAVTKSDAEAVKRYEQFHAIKDFR